MSAPDLVVHGVAEDATHVTVTVPVGHEERLADRWPPFGLRRSNDAPVLADRQFRLDAADPAESSAWDRLESDLALFTVERLQQVVAVHAAVLVIDGRALILPGRSYSGKSTLSLALRSVGARLASDEYALVNPMTGMVTGWPRPARIRMGPTGSRREPVEPLEAPVPVGMVGLLRFDDRADGALDVDEPSRAEAVVAILDETVCARSRPEESLDAALRLTQALTLRGRRGEADDAAVELLMRFRAVRS
jgi:hypothetical protein